MVIDFTDAKIEHIASEFERWGEDLIATMLYEILRLYQVDAIGIIWEEGMPVPVNRKEKIV